MIILTALYIIIALLVFGLLVIIHEGGHFFFARLFGVTVNEFSVGMGPKIISRKSKKSGINYSLRALPFGGFVSMAGEDESSDDENAFCNKPVWQRMIITAAGPLVNIFVGLLIMAILIISSKQLYGTVVYDTPEIEDVTVSAEAQGLLPGDRIVSVGGAKVHIVNDLVYEIMRRGIDPCDVVVIRDGERVTLKDFRFPVIEEQGSSFGEPNFRIAPESKTVGSVLKHTFFRSTSTIKMIWEQLFDLLRGRYSLKSVSGPVGVAQALGEAAKTGFGSLLFLTVFISINLGIMNLLPFPALDGGRLLFQLIELVRGKPISRRVEGYIHFAGLALLMLLMVAVTFKDVFGLIKR